MKIMLVLLSMLAVGCTIKEEKTEEEFLVETIAHKMILCSAGNSESDKFFNTMGDEKYEKTLKTIKKNLLGKHDLDGLKAFYWLSMRMSCEEIKNFANTGNQVAKKPKLMADQIVRCQAKQEQKTFKQLMNTEKIKSQHKGLIKAFSELRDKNINKFNEFYSVVATGNCEKIKKFLKK